MNARPRWRTTAALLTLVAAVVYVGTVTSSAGAKGVTRDQLEAHGWTCLISANGPRPGRVLRPGRGRPFPGNPDPRPWYRPPGVQRFVRRVPGHGSPDTATTSTGASHADASRTSSVRSSDTGSTSMAKARASRVRLLGVAVATGVAVVFACLSVRATAAPAPFLLTFDGVHVPDSTWASSSATTDGSPRPRRSAPRDRPTT